MPPTPPLRRSLRLKQKRSTSSRKPSSDAGPGVTARRSHKRRTSVADAPRKAKRKRTASSTKSTRKGADRKRRKTNAPPPPPPPSQPPPPPPPLPEPTNDVDRLLRDIAAYVDGATACRGVTLIVGARADEPHVIQFRKRDRSGTLIACLDPGKSKRDNGTTIKTRMLNSDGDVRATLLPYLRGRVARIIVDYSVSKFFSALTAANCRDVLELLRPGGVWFLEPPTSRGGGLAAGEKSADFVDAAKRSLEDAGFRVDVHNDARYPLHNPNRYGTKTLYFVAHRAADGENAAKPLPTMRPCRLNANWYPEEEKEEEEEEEEEKTNTKAGASAKSGSHGRRTTSAPPPPRDVHVVLVILDQRTSTTTTVPATLHAPVTGRAIHDAVRNATADAPKFRVIYAGRLVPDSNGVLNDELEGDDIQVVVSK